jgi:hypothetical protein
MSFTFPSAVSASTLLRCFCGCDGVSSTNECPLHHEKVGRSEAHVERRGEPRTLRVAYRVPSNAFRFSEEYIAVSVPTQEIPAPSPSRSSLVADPCEQLCLGIWNARQRRLVPVSHAKLSPVAIEPNTVPSFVPKRPEDGQLRKRDAPAVIEQCLAAKGVGGAIAPPRAEPWSGLWDVDVATRRELYALDGRWVE